MASFSSTYPAQRPIFSLDAANAGRLDPRCSFTRSDTPPTYAAPSAVHYWSNEKHLSSENLITNSEDFSAWTATNTTPTANAVAAPDGTTTADTITGNSGSGSKYVLSNSISAAPYPVISVYAKAGTHSYIQIHNDQSSTHYANFDVTSGAGVVGSLGSNTTATIQPVGSTGWYRCICRIDTASMTSGIKVRLVDSASAAFGATTTTTGTVHLWGAMANTQGDLTNIVAYQSSTTQIHREYAPTLKSVATAGQPRFEYDPSTDGQSVAKGILVEGASTNLLTYSEDFTNAAWVKPVHGLSSTLSVSASAAIGPDGLLSACAAVASSTAGYQEIRHAATVGSGAVAFSVYAKAIGSGKRLLLREDATGSSAAFDLITGTVAANNSGGVGSIEAVGNDWYRCAMVCTPGSGSQLFAIWAIDNAATNFGSVTGDDYSGFLLFGAQVEQNSFSSSYIKSNAGSATTRAAESLSMTDSSLFDNGGGALFVEASSSDKAAAYSGIASLNDGSSNNRVEVYNYYTYVRGDVSADGATQSSQYGGAFSSDVAYKACLTYDSNNVSLYANGSEIGATDTAATMPTVDRITLGNTNSGTNYLNGHIKRVALYSEPISETAAAALTS